MQRNASPNFRMVDFRLEASKRVLVLGSTGYQTEQTIETWRLDAKHGLPFGKIVESVEPRTPRLPIDASVRSWLQDPRAFHLPTGVTSFHSAAHYMTLNSDGLGMRLEEDLK